MVVLLIAGVGAIVAGLLAIWFGIPVKEFSFGNTLILAGAVAICSGLLLIGLSLVVRQLKIIAQRLRVIEPEAQLRDIGGPPLPAGSIVDSSRDMETGTLTSPRDPFSNRDAAAAGSPGMPWRDEAAARERGRAAASTPPAEQEPAEPEEPAAPQGKQRRNLLFTSSRRERERVQAQTRGTEAIPDSSPPSLPPESDDAKPQPHPSFDEAWPKVDRPRREPASSHAAPPPVAAPHADASAAAKHEPEAPQVTVVKSGVVDGMAYWLYSDGSVEAQMPEGMMRFASIDELRQHLDQRP